METKNAKIENTYLGYEGHGILTCYLALSYGGSGQSFGGYELKHPAYGINFIDKILKTIGVDSWEQLSGKMIRVKAERTGISAIGHIIEEKWFSPQDLEKEANND
jgi:hypothetical protein